MKKKRDVVVVLGDYENDGPLHVELVAHGVYSRKGGLKTIVDSLGRASGARSWVAAGEGECVLMAEIGEVTLTVVIRADAEKIEDNARIEIVGD